MASDNVATKALVRTCGVPRDEFVRRMNALADSMNLAGTRFVNVAEWESQQAFADSIAAPEFQEAARPLADLATMSPALYDVVYEA